jgi:hypothetical protein
MIDNFGIWGLLTIIAVIALIVFWRGPNSVWGGLTGGLIVGLIIAIIKYFGGNGFSFYIVGKGIVLGAVLGLGAEMLSKLSGILKKKKP